MRKGGYVPARKAAPATGAGRGTGHRPGHENYHELLRGVVITAAGPGHIITRPGSSKKQIGQVDVMFGRSGAAVEFLADWQIGDALLRVIAQARQQLTLVSPYNKHWGHLKREVAAAQQRGVAVTIYYRADEPGPLAEYAGVTVIPVRMLHAKIYANESVTLVTTMNLLETSAMYSPRSGAAAYRRQTAPGGWRLHQSPGGRSGRAGIGRGAGGASGATERRSPDAGNAGDIPDGDGNCRAYQGVRVLHRVRQPQRF